MGNVTVPTPVLVAGGALCLLGGYLVGAVAGPDSPDRTTATVASFDGSSGRLCLTGDGVADAAGASDGRLCGTWRRSGSAHRPVKGDRFRFVSVVGTSSSGASGTVIYGDVVE